MKQGSRENCTNNVFKNTYEVKSDSLMTMKSKGTCVRCVARVLRVRLHVWSRAVSALRFLQAPARLKAGTTDTPRSAIFFPTVYVREVSRNDVHFCAFVVLPLSSPTDYGLTTTQFPCLCLRISPDSLRLRDRALSLRRFSSRECVNLSEAVTSLLLH